MKEFIFKITLLFSIALQTVNLSCLLYDSNNSAVCLKCQQGYYPLILSPDKIPCAQKVQGQNLCTYPESNNSTGQIKFYDNSISQRFQSYCFNEELFKNEVGCDKSTPSPGESDSYVRQQIFKQVQTYCGSCPSGYQEKLVYLAQFNLLLGTCIKSTFKCSYSQYFNPQTQKCQDCSLQFGDKCLACNQSECLACEENYFFNPKVYNERTQRFEARCMLDSCPRGYCKWNDYNRCVKTSIESSELCNYEQVRNATTGALISEKETVLQCAKKTRRTPDQAMCISQMDEDIQIQRHKTYFILANAPLTKAEGHSFLDFYQHYDPDVDGFAESLENASPLLLLAFTQFSYFNMWNQNTTAKIYLGKGDHFMFSCSQLDNAIFKDSELSQQYINWCDMIFKKPLNEETGQFNVNFNDNYDIVVDALFCDLGTSLNMTTNSLFLKNCIPRESGQRPIIYVNHANSYFNISGKVTFRNLEFNGVNQQLYDNSQRVMAMLPRKYCSMPEHKARQTISPVHSISQEWTCKDVFYSGSVSAYDEQPNIRCTEQPQLKSTLSCHGSPLDQHYFTLDETPINTSPYYWPYSSSNNHPYRRKTLFNLYSLDGLQSTRQANPELIIENCRFDNFISDYESLIYFENDNIWQVKKQLPSFGTENSKLFYLTYNALSGNHNKGAKVTISNSSFTNSRFCKGLLVYREPIDYESNQDKLLNLTQLSITPEESLNIHTDSHILLTNCTFSNLNVFSNLTALAIYNGVNPTIQLPTLQGEDLSYQLFIHRGIVLNLQDFPGKVEVTNSIFERNGFYIPEIQQKYQVEDKSQIEEYLYKDQMNDLQEFKLGICQNNKDKHLLDNINLTGGLFDNFERIALNYIARNQDKVIFLNNTFSNNVGGLYGGALTIEQSDWTKGKEPLVVIVGNTFSRNMAYLSGNAVYMRSLKLSKDHHCFGLHLYNNTFSQNSGLKKHNGGAVSLICESLNSSLHKISYASSTLSNEGLLKAQKPIVIQLLSDQQTNLVVTDYQTLAITSNIFLDNHSGGKGTAFYLSGWTQVSVQDCLFQNNGPLYSAIEKLYSPYYLMYSNKTISYYDEVCSDELEYLEKCYPNNKLELLWPQTQGALYVNFEDSSSSLQKVNITRTNFTSNEAGPIFYSNYQQDVSVSQIFINQGQNIKINQCNFKDNKGTPERYFSSFNSSSQWIEGTFPYLSNSMSPLMYFNTQNQESIIELQNNIFVNNSNTQITPLTLSSKSVSNHQQLQGSLIHLLNSNNKHNVNLTVEDSIIQDNYFQGTSGALIYYENANLTLNGNIISNNGLRHTKNMIDQRSFGIVNMKMLRYGFHNFKNNNIDTLLASQGGVVQCQQDCKSDIVMQNNKYNNVISSNSGGILYAKNLIGTITIHNESLENVYSSWFGAYTILGDEQTHLTITNSSFINTKSQLGSTVYFNNPGKLSVQNCTFTQLNDNQAHSETVQQYGQVYIESISNFNLYHELISINASNLSGTHSTFLHLKNADANIDSLRVINSTTSNGIIGLDDFSWLTINDLVIENCTSSDKASGISIGEGSNVTVTKALFQNNQAKSQGTVVLENQGRFNCSNCRFIGNTAQDSSVLVAQQDSVVSITNSQIEMNTAQSNMITLFHSELFMNLTNFTSNSVALLSSGIQLYHSKALLYNLDIQNSTDLINVPFFLIQAFSVLTFRRSFVTSMLTPLLYAHDYCNISLDTISLTGLQSPQNDLIYTQNCQTLTLNQVNFKNNQAHNELSIVNTPARINNCNFLNGTGRYVQQEGSTLEISKSSFINGSIIEGAGKAIKALNQVNLTIANSQFRNLQSQLSGGAIYIEKSNATIKLNNIFDNTAQENGGAIALIDVAQAQIEGNFILRNQASQMGGAIYSQCASNINCKVEMSNLNEFVENNALYRGGAIQKFNTLLTRDNTNVFTNNYSPAGKDFGMNPSKAQLIFNPEFQNQEFESGKPFSFIMQILDEIGQLYNVSGPHLSAIISQKVEHDRSIQIKQNIAHFNEGRFEFNNVTIYAEQGQTHQFEIKVVNMETYGQKIEFIEKPMALVLTLKNCSNDQRYNIQQMLCEDCPLDTYSKLAPNNQRECLPCPYGAICFGKSFISTQKGFWRNTSTSLNIIQCPNQLACQEGNQSNLMGNCSKGYEGLACAQCSQGFMMRGSKLICEKCPSKSMTILKIVIGIILSIAVIALFVWSFSTSKLTHNLPILLRIMSNHFQIYAALALLHFDWPSPLQQIHQGQSLVAQSPLNNIFDWNCLMQDTETLPVYFQKLIMFEVLPLALFVFCFIIYAILNSIFSRCSNQQYLKRVLIVTAYFVHPIVTQVMLQSFDCIVIDGLKLFKYDIRYQCYTGMHLKVIQGVTIPSLILWTIGLPIGGYIIAKRNQPKFPSNSLGKQNNEQEYIISNIINRGYKTKRFYYEILIMERKVAVLTTAILLSFFSDSLAILVTSIILSISLSSQEKIKPYAQKSLNHLQFLSLFVPVVTLFIGLFYSIYSQHILNKAQWLFFACMIIVNSGFYLYWLWLARIELLKILYVHSDQRPKLFKLIAFMEREAFYKFFMMKQQQSSVIEKEQIPLAEKKNNSERQSIGHDGPEEQFDFEDQPQQIKKATKVRNRTQRKIQKEPTQIVSQDQTAFIKQQLSNSNIQISRFINIAIPIIQSQMNQIPDQLEDDNEMEVSLDSKNAFAMNDSKVPLNLSDSRYVEDLVPPNNQGANPNNFYFSSSNRSSAEKPNINLEDNHSQFLNLKPQEKELNYNVPQRNILSQQQQHRPNARVQQLQKQLIEDQPQQVEAIQHNQEQQQDDKIEQQKEYNDFKVVIQNEELFNNSPRGNQIQVEEADSQTKQKTKKKKKKLFKRGNTQKNEQ